MEKKKMKLEVNGKEYITYKWIKENLNLTSNRVKRWRDGKGGAKLKPLNYIKLNETQFLYCKEDIELLTNLLKDKK